MFSPLQLPGEPDRPHLLEAPLRDHLIPPAVPQHGLKPADPPGSVWTLLSCPAWVMVGLASREGRLGGQDRTAALTIVPDPFGPAEWDS